MKTFTTATSLKSLSSRKMLCQEILIRDSIRKHKVQSVRLLEPSDANATGTLNMDMKVLSLLLNQ